MNPRRHAARSHSPADAGGISARLDALSAQVERVLAAQHASQGTLALARLDALSVLVEAQMLEQILTTERTTAMQAASDRMLDDMSGVRRLLETMADLRRSSN